VWPGPRGLAIAVIRRRPSPNFDSRRGQAVDTLVIHYTGMIEAEAALARLCDPTAKVSAHYFIAQDGAVTALVDEAMRAWHAGQGFWGGARDVNAVSIGIELCNPGHDWGYGDFPAPQIAALIGLGREIVARHAIPAWRVIGHSDLAPARKIDPGERFPWRPLAASGLGLWPEGADMGKGTQLAADLRAYGYDPEAPDDAAIAAFQRHFRPARIDGQADAECAGLAARLLTLKANALS